MDKDVKLFSGYFSRGQYADAPVYVHMGKCLLSVLICRFQAQDMEVQLSDELAGSLRQLKVQE